MIGADFLDETEPRSESYIHLGLRKRIAAVIDSKEFLSWMARKDCAVSVLLHSNKPEDSALWVITWSSSIGLIFEYTIPFLG